MFALTVGSGAFHLKSFKQKIQERKLIIPRGLCVGLVCQGTGNCFDSETDMHGNSLQLTFYKLYSSDLVINCEAVLLEQ